ncbi:pyruvate dehydrogenase [acetyl-transferring]-phosphatase 1, mitochondrial [Condylostylus longicornis]|uniref:pyruvate dehydrogenase [acetyl-transferring]-phosphatase 1, mitochondrial n=1 Tax=Condylostylus longicornis TaxID=2530218 RepID=UPI00244DC7E6|nr:pyruvate dehydrogenase [acetyl-transferring]-phosphatase 1, mitochondrial [Condylostylus longicornis]
MNKSFFKFTILNQITEFVNKYCSLSILSPYDVNLILRENEYCHIFPKGSRLKGFDTNQLASNNPIEDSRTEASLIHTNGFVCGVFDGHGGPACSQVVSKRLLRYLAASLVPYDTLCKELSEGATSQSFLKCHNDKVDFVKEIRDLYEESFLRYVHLSLANKKYDIKERIENSVISLDEDLSREALEYPNVRTMSVAMSGAVACVALVTDVNVYIANIGDCAAVIGSCSESGQWITKVLTHEHNSDNIAEVKRILSEHPVKEKDTVIRNDRLLGQLAPLRALGDFRYKWSKNILKQVVVPKFGEIAVPLHYNTPPYLTAKPEVICHKILENDKFLVIASDGLWDFLSPTQVVNLVGEHILGKAFLEPFSFMENHTIKKAFVTLTQRKDGKKHKPLDQNSATHLIRNALGGTEYGIEHSKLSYYLSLPKDISRQYRDDITITVLFFNNDIKNSKTLS